MFEDRHCDIYGPHDDAIASKQMQVTVSIDGITETLDVCDMHYHFFQTTDPEHYAIGKTFTGQVEVRPIPSQPAPPADPPQEDGEQV